MDQDEIMAALVDLPLGGLRFYRSTGSTNDVALAWAAEGAQDLSLVVADEQRAGRGRSGRKWHTPAGSALALSLILRPHLLEQRFPAQITGLGALALLRCCSVWGVEALIKWPNDVLIGDRKVAGILVESVWTGSTLHASVLGMGVNVLRAAVPHADQLGYSATSLETELGGPLSRVGILRDILAAILEWRSSIGSATFIQAWETALAFRGQEVYVNRDNELPLQGKLLGIEPDGSLRLLTASGPAVAHFGEVHLRPSNDRIG